MRLFRLFCKIIELFVSFYCILCDNCLFLVKNFNQLIMKKTLKAVFLLAIVTIFSCDSGSDGDSNSNSFSVKIDGENYNAEVTSAIIYNGTLAIQASDENLDNFFNLSVLTAEEGIYEITGNAADHLTTPAMVYRPQESSQYLSYIGNPNVPGSGTLTITEIDTENQTVSGTFSFTGTVSYTGETMEFENGVFNNIPYSTDLPSDFSGGTANLDLDGEAYDPTNVSVNRSSILTTELITINLNKSGKPGIGLSFSPDTEVGTFDFSSFGDYRIIMNHSNTSVSYVESGSITILTHDVENRSMTGTFEAVLIDSNSYEQIGVITNGEFDIVYEE